MFKGSISIQERIQLSLVLPKSSLRIRVYLCALRDGPGQRTRMEQRAYRSIMVSQKIEVVVAMLNQLS